MRSLTTEQLLKYCHDHGIEIKKDNVGAPTLCGNPITDLDVQSLFCEVIPCSSTYTTDFALTYKMGKQKDPHFKECTCDLSYETGSSLPPHAHSFKSTTTYLRNPTIEVWCGECGPLSAA